MAYNGSTDFSILARVRLDASDIQKQLDEFSKKTTLKFDSSQVDTAAKSVSNLGNEVKQADENVVDATLTWQQYREMLDTAVDAMKSFAEQTFEVDAALTEFKKVSDLSGDSLDAYVDKLTAAGKQVARTGKPNRSEPE